MFQHSTKVHKTLTLSASSRVYDLWLRFLQKQLLFFLFQLLLQVLIYLITICVCGMCVCVHALVRTYMHVTVCTRAIVCLWRSDAMCNSLSSPFTRCALGSHSVSHASWQVPLSTKVSPWLSFTNSFKIRG